MRSLSAASFDIRHEGAVVRDAEVCFFAAGAAASPITRFLEDAKVTCVDANGVIPLPAHAVNVFARRGTDLISDRVLLVTPDDHERKALTLRPVRRLGIAAGIGERSAGYVVRTASIIPGDVAPADERVVPLVVKGGRIVHVELDAPRNGKKGPVVIVPVVFPAAAPARKHLPTIEIGGAAPEVGLAAAEPSLVFFRAKTGGDVHVSLHGEGWKTVEQTFAVEPRGVTTTPPMSARAIASLNVHWRATTELPALKQDCEAAETVGVEPEPVRLKATLLRLPKEEDSVAPGDPAGERELEYEQHSGTLRYEEIPDGRYLLRLTHPLLPALEAKVDVSGETDLELDVHYIRVTGTIRKGSQSVHARVLGTVSSPHTGMYSAVLASVPPPASMVYVEPCDASPPYRFVPPIELRDNAVLDIDIPDNRITVRVSDEGTGAPIADAHVTYSTQHGDAHINEEGGRTGAGGRTVIAPVTPTGAFTVCGEAKGFESSCAEPLAVAPDTNRDVELRLARKAERRGQVSLGGDPTGRVFWCTSDGQVTESVAVSADGRFTYGRHAESEIVTYAGRSQPLIALRYPRLGIDDVFEIRLENPVRVRTISVGLSPESHEEAAFVTVMVGDLVVPAAAMDSHLMMRGARRSLRPGTTTIAAIAEPAPLTVVLLPFSLLQQSKFGDRDYAYLPDVAAAFPRKRVGDEVTIEFP